MQETGTASDNGQEISEKMRRAWLAGFPETMPLRRKVGMELEMIAVEGLGEEKGKALRPTDVGSLMKAIQKRNSGYKQCESGMSLIGSSEHGESIKVGTDYGSGTLEVAVPPACSLKETEAKLNSILDPILMTAEEDGRMILGYGTQPLSAPSEDIVMPKKRYDAIKTALRPWFIYLNSITAATQVHIDIARDEIAPATNVLNAVSPQVIALCANSAVVLGQNSGYSDFRGVAWDEVVSFRQNTRRNSDRKGIAPALSDANSYWDWMLKFTPILTKRGENYLAYKNISSMKEYLTRGMAKAKIIGSSESVIITPEPIDMMIHEGTVWTEARPKSATGTIELRSAACQPDQEGMMAVAALTLGLISNMKMASEMVSKYTHPDLVKGRESAIKKGMKARLADEPIAFSIHKLLAVAYDGLRNIKEETRYLDPLWNRLERGLNPSDESLRVLRRKGTEGLLKYTRLQPSLDKVAYSF